jgi:hypothetical protein
MSLKLESLNEEKCTEIIVCIGLSGWADEHVAKLIVEVTHLEINTSV